MSQCNKKNKRTHDTITNLKYKNLRMQIFIKFSCKFVYVFIAVKPIMWVPELLKYTDYHKSEGLVPLIKFCLFVSFSCSIDDRNFQCSLKIIIMRNIFQCNCLKPKS